MYRQGVKYGFVALVLAFLIGLVTLNYFAVTALIFGGLISLPVMRLVRFIGSDRTRILLAVIVVLIASNLSLFVFFSRYLRHTSNIMSGDMPPLLVNKYHLTIESSNWQSGVFLIKETLDFYPQSAEYYQVPPSINLPEREVSNTDIGLLTREIKIMPFQADSMGSVAITLPDGRTLYNYACYSCENVIELRDAPQGSFLAAKDAEKIQKYPYVDTETISWSVINIEEGVTLAFVPPPFHYVRPIIELLLGVSGLNEWVLGILGLIGSVFLAPIVRPVLLATAQKRFGSWLDQYLGVRTREATNSKFLQRDLLKPEVIFLVKIPDSPVVIEGALDQVDKDILKVAWAKLPDLRDIASDLVRQNQKDYFSLMRFQFNFKSGKWEIAYLTLSKSGRRIPGPK